MKKNLFSICLIFLALLVATYIGIAFAAGDDHFNAGTVTIYEDADQVVVLFQVVLASGADTTGQWHSKPVYIGDCNAVDGYAYAVQGAAGDVNVIYHYSATDKSTWLAQYAPITLDQVSNTAKLDTLGLTTGDDTKFHFARYLVVELDGQTANASNTITWEGRFQKDGYLLVTDKNYLGNQRVSTGASTNP